MHEDVVQLAQAILQILQRRQKSRVTFFLLFPGKQRFKKLGGVTEFFDLDAKLVPGGEDQVP